MSAPEVTMLALSVSFLCPAPSPGDKGCPPSSKQQDQMMAPSDLETTMETLPFKPGRLTKSVKEKPEPQAGSAMSYPGRRPHSANRPASDCREENRVPTGTSGRRHSWVSRHWEELVG